MRNNTPVTQREFDFDGTATLMSTTDPDSRLTYANAAFIHVSGFEKDELLGEPHNVVRHPDMPREAFADMWATLKSGQSWTALVKNRRKNGDHYWVRANATPVRRDGRVIGYMSVRTKPTRAEIGAAEELYRDFREGRSRERAFHRGIIVRTGVMRWASLLQLMPCRWRARIGVAVVALPGMLAAALAPEAGVVGVAATLAVGAVLAGWWLESQITGPLERLAQQAQGVAAGQSEEVPPLNRVDEIGLLARSINQSGLNLRALLDDVALQVEGVRTASTEIAQGNADLSARTEQSAASLQQTAASMAQMTSTIGNNAERTRQAEQLAQVAADRAAAGAAVVGRVNDTMQRIQTGSRRIAEITSLIDGLAFQTNILALNAAVEAARAGEQGRGFAVVAGEVRSLAQRSAAAAKDIRALIEESVQSVGAGGELVSQADSTIQDVVQRVRQVGTLVNEIAHATGEQSQGISQVDAAVAQLDQTTQQNAAMVEESAAAADSLRQQSLRLAEAIEAFRG